MQQWGWQVQLWGWQVQQWGWRALPESFPASAHAAPQAQAAGATTKRLPAIVPGAVYSATKTPYLASMAWQAVMATIL